MKAHQATNVTVNSVNNNQNLVTDSNPQTTILFTYQPKHNIHLNDCKNGLWPIDKDGFSYFNYTFELLNSLDYKNKLINWVGNYEQAEDVFPVTQATKSYIRAIFHQLAEITNLKTNEVDHNSPHQVTFLQYQPKNLKSTAGGATLVRTKYLTGNDVTNKFRSEAVVSFSTNSFFGNPYSRSFNYSGLEIPSEFFMRATVTHELGHLNELNHFDDTVNRLLHNSSLIAIEHPHMHPAEPNEILEIKDIPYKLTTSYSIMNRKHAEYYYFNNVRTKIMPVNLMPADYRALQWAMGVNTNTRSGDDTYNLKSLAYNTFPDVYQVFRTNIFSWGTNILLRFGVTPNAAMIASFPWDSAGQDTYDASGIGTDMVVNLNPEGLSKVEHVFFKMPDIEIENFIAGPGRLKLVLNSLDNYINLNNAEKPIKLFSDIANGGIDIVEGYNPLKDSVIIADTHSMIKYVVQDLTFKNFAMNDTLANGSVIKFNDNNAIIFKDVDAKEIVHSIRIMNEADASQFLWSFYPEIKKDPLEYLIEIFPEMTAEAQAHFKNALIETTIFTVLMFGSTEALTALGCNQKNIDRAHLALQLCLIFLPGTWVNLFAAFAGMAASSALRYNNYSPASCTAASLTVSKGIKAFNNIYSPIDIVNLAVDINTTLVTANVVMWACTFAKNKVKTALRANANANEAIADEKNNQNRKVNNSNQNLDSRTGIAANSFTGYVLSGQNNLVNNVFFWTKNAVYRAFPSIKQNETVNNYERKSKSV